MINSGRYRYHLQDIAAAESGTGPDMMLAMMKQEVAEFEAANPDEAKKIQEEAAASSA